MDYAYLGIAGFLLGAFFYTAYITTRYEPGSKAGYLFVAIGILMSVAVNVWLDFLRDGATWVRAAIIISYALISGGLILITRQRLPNRE